MSLAFALACTLTCATTAAQDKESSAASIEEVTVTGEWSGPRMWKISKGDHVLWLLGTLEPLPKKMTWQSKEVESLLAEAQEVLDGNPALSADVGLFGKLQLYFQWRRMQKSEDRATLKTTLSPELYARFAALKTKYAPHDDGLDKLRPMFAAGKLYGATVDASGLSYKNIVGGAVTKIAKQHDVKIQRVPLKVDDPKGVLREVGETPTAAEISCLETTIARLEIDVEPMKQRAAAWAMGDVDTLRRLPYPDNLAACWEAVSGSNRLKELRARFESEWMTAAEEALQRNRVTLAMRSMRDVIGEGNVLEKFRAQGYAIEGP